MSKKPTFDLNRSLELIFQQKSSGSTASWSGWKATDWLRLRVALMGGSHSGAEAGATLIFSRSWISPTLTTEAGHCSGGDAFSRIRVLTKSPYLDPALLRSFSYDYEAAYLGVEAGVRRVAISVNLGLTRAENSYRSIQSAAAAVSNAIAPIEDARTAQIGPAAKLALLVRL